MANSLSHVLPYPIRQCLFTLEVSFRTAAGTPTDPTTPDTELSSDGGATFADCTNEITTGGTNGAGYLTLTSTELNANVVWIAAKSANCLTTLVPLYPRILASVGTGTLSAGSAGGGTLGTLLAYDVTGCFIQTTGGTGGASGAFQARRIVTYNTTTGVFTVTPNWETTPDATTTYSVLLPEGVTLGMLKTLNPTTAGRTLDVAATGEAGLDFNNVLSSALVTLHSLAITNTTTLSGAVSFGSTFGVAGTTTFAAINTGAVGLGALSMTTLTASGAVAFQSTFIVTGATTFTGAVTASHASNQISLGTSMITAGVVADGAIDRATFAADTGLQTIRSNTAQTGGASTITLDASASAVNNLYLDDWVYLTGGTGVGQCRLITAYNGTTKIATVSSGWATVPDATTTFAILPAAKISSVTTVDDIATQINSALGSYGVALASELGSRADDAADGNPTTGDTLIAYVKQLINTLEGTAGIPAWPAAAAPGNAVSIAEAVRSIYTQIGVAGAGLTVVATAAALASVKTDTGTTIPATLAVIAGYIDTEIGTIVTAVGTTIPATLATIAGYVDTEVQAGSIRAALGLASANLDTQLGLLSTAAKLLKYVQLLARKDSAIATDNATELTAINATGGSGAGSYVSTTDALQALSDAGGGSGGTVGSGAISWTITVNSSGNVAIAGVDVWVSTDSAGTNVVAGTLVTDAFGQVTFMLDAGTYYVWQSRAGYNFTNPTAITVV